MIQIPLQVDPEILLSLNKSPKEFGEELKLWAAIGFYEHGKLSLAKAANVAGYHRLDFEKILAKLNIPISLLEIDDILNDLTLFEIDGVVVTPEYAKATYHKRLEAMNNGQAISIDELKNEAERW